MKPFVSLAGSLVATLAIVIGLGFIASQVPVSTAAAPPEVTEVGGANPVADAEVVGLEVVVEGIRNEKGRVIVAVFDDPMAFEAYDYDRAIGYGEIDVDTATQGTVRLPFPELTSGPYAVSLFHDENNDYDFNMDGEWPLEGYGTSGAKDAYDEPTFEEAAVDGGSVIVRMFYL